VPPFSLAKTIRCGATLDMDRSKLVAVDAAS
jgi:hypothetical protein